SRQFAPHAAAGDDPTSCGRTCSDDAALPCEAVPARLPLLFFDRELSSEYADLVAGRARVGGAGGGRVDGGGAGVARPRRAGDDRGVALGAKGKVRSRMGGG